MNLNTITEVKRPTAADQITQWRDGYAWLAGGTWLFSEPQRRQRPDPELSGALDQHRLRLVAEPEQPAAAPDRCRGSGAGDRALCRDRAGVLAARLNQQHCFKF